MNFLNSWIDQFQKLYIDRADIINEWKEKGGHCLGYIYAHVPEELMHAAGILPVQMLEAGGPVVKAYRCLPQFFCYQGLGNLELAMRGDYDYMDGVVISHSCDPIRKVYGVWENNIPMKFSHFLPLPLKSEPRALQYYEEELNIFKKALEKFVGAEITEEKILSSISIYNKNRELVRKLYELRKEDSPIISGSDLVDVLKSSVVVPREVHNDILEGMLHDISLAQPAEKKEGKGKRIFVSLISMNDRPLMEMIEDLGAQVVLDDMAMGARYHWAPVEFAKGEGSLAALSRRYVNAVPFAGRYPREKRADMLIEMCKAYGIDGAIFKIERYCDPYLFENPYAEQRFRDAGITVLSLDYGNIKAEGGRVRTRIQAFLETLK